MSLLKPHLCLMACSVAALAGAVQGRALAHDAANRAQSPADAIYVPTTVSPQWAALFKTLNDLPVRSPPPTAAPDDLAGWARARESFSQAAAPFIKRNDELIAQRGWKVNHQTEGGVPTLVVKPKGMGSTKEVLIYLHGGAYTFGSAATSVSSAGLMADASGLPVIAVDYTLAPEAKWRTIIDQVISVYRSVLAQGYRADAIGIFGDSAGGGLTVGATLAMRDRGLPLPGALVLWSPWADITASGDTYETLKSADPALQEDQLQACADAYAARADQKNPYVSPVYGDFAKGFPPVLVQGGTKEIFLSHFVRLYQAIDSAGGTAKLDLYEGMPHVFQVFGVGTPESDTALHKAAQFWHRYLR